MAEIEITQPNSHLYNTQMHFVAEALEKKIETLEHLAKCYDDPSVRGVHVAWNERHIWLTDIKALTLADPYYWNARTVELTTQLQPDFELSEITCSRHLLYSDIAFHWFPEKPPFQIQAYNSEEFLDVKALSSYWFSYKEKDGRLDRFLGMTAWAQTNYLPDGTPTGYLHPVLWTAVGNGRPMNTRLSGGRLDFQGFVDERTETEIHLMKQFVVSASTFLRQEILVSVKTPPERPARKRLERQGYADLPQIQVINLRRAVQCQKEKNAEPSPVDWKWQWEVKGHTRQQYYPSLGEHLPVYIHRFLKGPVDKPLKPRSMVVHSVIR
jgi:hypothetical protein